MGTRSGALSLNDENRIVYVHGTDDENATICYKFIQAVEDPKTFIE